MEIDRSSFYQKHKKHKATSQQKYRLLVQQSFEWKKKWVTLAEICDLRAHYTAGPTGVQRHDTIG